MSEIDEVVAAIRAGQPVILPTDTVYGLCADGYRAAPARRLARLKGRPPGMPIALLAAELDVILDAIPELRGRAAVRARALLPGPLTLVLPDPGCRFPWLTGSNPHAIAIRVPDVPSQTRAVLDEVGAVAATSANLHGTPDPARHAELPRELVDAAVAVLDAGDLPGTPSTVLDLTGPRPRVLREGAVTAQEALARVAAVTND